MSSYSACEGNLHFQVFEFWFNSPATQRFFVVHSKSEVEFVDRYETKRHRYINVICVNRTLLWMIRWPHFRKDVFSVMGLALFLAPAKAISTRPCFMDDTTLFRD